MVNVPAEMYVISEMLYLYVIFEMRYQLVQETQQDINEGNIISIALDNYPNQAILPRFLCFSWKGK